MSQRYHISEDGKPRVCSAEEGACPVTAIDGNSYHGSVDEMVSKSESVLSSYYRGDQTLSKRVVVAVDLDGTLVDFTDGFRRFMAEKHNMSREESLKRYPEPTNYNFSKGENPWFKDTSEFLEHFWEAERSGLYRGMKARNGAIRVFKQLLKDDRVDVRIVTARNKKFNEDTLRNLNRKGLATDELPEIENLDGKEEYPAHIFIDDKDEFAAKILSGKYVMSDKIVKEVIIPEHPYNKHLPTDKSWGEIETRLDETVDRMYAQLNS